MKKLKQLIGVLLLSVALFSCSNPAVQADTITPQFEEQVLQVIRKHPEAIIDSVQSFQRKQQEEQRKGQQSFLDDLKNNPKAIVGKSPIKGSPQMKTVLVEFSDFQCPYCASAAATLKEFVNKNGKEVTLTYKHLPLTSIHQQALPAAKAAWAAGQQGKFWEFHDALFENQKQIGESFFTATAQSLKLDLKKFNSDRASKAADSAILQDVQLAEKLGISGTPFFAMKGQVFSGAVGLADLEAALQAK